MSENGGQLNEARVLVDRRGLHGRDLMLAQRLADDIESVRERGIAERPIALPWKRRSDGRGQQLLRVGELGLRLGESACDGADRFTGPVHGLPPRSGHRSSRLRISTAWPESHARWPPWRLPASGP